MEVVFSAFADAGNMGDNGKLNLLGVFRRIYYKKLPVVHPQMTWAVLLSSNDSPKDGTYAASLELASPAGKVLWTSPRNIDFLLAHDETEGKYIANFVIAIIGLRFTAPGYHSLRFKVDGTVVHEESLQLTPIPEAMKELL